MTNRDIKEAISQGKLHLPSTGNNRAYRRSISKVLRKEQTEKRVARIRTELRESKSEAK